MTPRGGSQHDERVEELIADWPRWQKKLNRLGRRTFGPLNGWLAASPRRGLVISRIAWALGALLMFGLGHVAAKQRWWPGGARHPLEPSDALANGVAMVLVYVVASGAFWYLATRSDSSQRGDG